MTVAELEARMGASELREWTVFWRMEPWGPVRDNIHAGLIAATIANVYRKKNTPPLTHQDYMLVDRDTHARKKSREFLGWLRGVGKRK